MRWLKAVTYAESLRPIYLSSKIFLLHFYTFDSITKTYHRSLLDLTLLVATLVADLYLFTYALRGVRAYFNSSESILIGTAISASFLQTFTITLVLPLWGSLKDRQMFELHMELANFDDLISEFGVCVDHRKHYLLSVVIICLSMGQALHCLAFGYAPSYSEYLGISDMFQSSWTTCAFVRAYLVLGLFSCHSILILHSIEKRFDLLNHALQNHLQKSTSRVIQKFASLHDLLSDSVLLYNQCYALPSLFIVASGFGVIVISWFCLIHALAVTEDHQFRQQLTGIMLYSGLYMIFVSPPMVLSCLLVSKCQRSAVMLHKIVCYGFHSKKTLKELRIFSQQLFHHVPRVSCRLFDYDWKLFYTMAGTIATYLVILIQFDLQFIK